MRNVQRLTIGVILCAPLALASCHPIQGIPPEGLRVISAEPGYTPEYGALVTVQRFEHSIGVHGEIYQEDRGYFIEDIRWDDGGLSSQTVLSAGGSHSMIQGSKFPDAFEGIEKPGYFTVDAQGVYDASLGDLFFTVENRARHVEDGFVEDICLVSWDSPRSPSPSHHGVIYCFFDELTDLIPTVETPPIYIAASAAPVGNEVTAVLASEDTPGEVYVARIDLVAEPSLVDAYVVDMEPIAEGRTPYVARMPVDVGPDGVIAVGVNWDGEELALLAIDDGTVDELFTTPIEDAPLHRRGLWRIFHAHGQWGWVIDDTAFLLGPDSTVAERDIADINPWHDHLWMKNRELAITTAKTLAVVDGAPVLVTATTREIEPGRSSLVRRTKTARYGVEICAVPLDVHLVESSHEDCMLLDDES